MLNSKVEKILNEQIEKEAYSSFLYLSMASWAEQEGMAGVAQWLYAQAEEEKLHMLKFIAYVNSRGGKAIIPAIKQAPNNWKDLMSVFQEVLKHEQYVTESINKIVALTIKETDYATHNWLQWFVTEQIEEESSVQIIIDKLKLIGNNNLYLFDKDIMALRTTTTTA